MKSLVAIGVSLLIGFGVGIYWQKSSTPTKQDVLEEKFNKLPKQIKRFTMKTAVDAYEELKKLRKK